jgi:hypothetical protein
MEKGEIGGRSNGEDRKVEEANNLRKKSSAGPSPKLS